MASYELQFRASVRKDLSPLPKSDIRRILKRIEAMADDPRPAGCEKLSNLERYRIRQGRYRIIYAVDDEGASVTVVKIGHRREVYR